MMANSTFHALLLSAGLAGWEGSGHAAETVGSSILSPTGAVWRYFDAATEVGSTWSTNTFDDGKWAAGPAPLGYGDAGLGTEIARSAEPRPVTAYFRREFVLPAPPGVRTLTVRLACDDGAIVYLNGLEIYRRNLFAGPTTALTPAFRQVDGAAERRFSGYPVLPYLALPGTNVLAVELHQHTNGLADASVDLELAANLPLTPPSAQLTFPTNGAVLPLGFVRFQVETSDTDGFVYLVRYWLDGVLVGESQSEPFTLNWLPSGSGRHRLVAEAFDNSGRRSESDLVYFQVGNVSETRAIRGPYLQSCSTTSVVVRWRSDWPTASWVTYGFGPGDLDERVTDPSPMSDHEIRLTGLRPDTTYYYAVGSEAGPNVGGSGPDFKFTTAPEQARPIRFWAIGDSGTADDAAAEVQLAYLNLGGRTDLWLMLGDNAYEEGEDSQYQKAVFEMYPRLLRSVCLWPTLGNHDAALVADGKVPPYLDIFTLPRQGEAGGIASGQELYYSFDYGNIHFVCLDAQLSDRSPGGPMLTWLEQDLAATAKDWIVAFWHHPPYTWGTHDSDSDQQLIEMRQFAAPILEGYGVDLVLCGHSHVYERSFLLNGYYGSSSNLSASMLVDAGSGRPSEGQSYRKPSGGLGANQGAVYVVCGCSGKGETLPFRRHPAMVTNLTGFGSVIVDVDGLRMDVRFLTSGGTIADWFRLDKRPPGPAVAPRLSIQRLAPGIEVRWPTSESTYRLESRVPLSGTGEWRAVPGAPRRVGRTYHLPAPAAVSNEVFRLRRVP